MSFVRVRELGKSYGETRIFENIEFDIRKGEFITLLGPSGCGKSTLLRCIAGLNSINEGEIYVDNQAISSLPPKDREIGMVFQNYALFPNMTVSENIAFGLKLRGDRGITSKVSEAIEMVELEGRENYYPNELSGGQRQRVALARSLVMNPKILLLDEPLSALDAKVRKSLREKIREIQKKLGITTIFVTHDQEEALTVSDRIFVMDRGSFAQVGTPEEIYTHPANEFVVKFIGNYNIVEGEAVNAVFEGEIEGNTIAIRPESIYVREEGRNYVEENFICKRGTILDSLVLGNIIRYTVERNGIRLIVDLLNRGENKLYSIGTEVGLMFMRSELKSF